MGVPSLALACIPFAREILASFMAAASAGAFLEASAASSRSVASSSTACAIVAPSNTANAMLASLMRCLSFRGVIGMNWFLAMLRIEGRLDVLGEALGRGDPPEVQEQDPGLLPCHVLMNRHDVDAGAAQRFQHRLWLGLLHREVSVDDRLVVAARERRPGVDAHRAGHHRTVHLRLAADRDRVGAVLEVGA